MFVKIQNKDGLVRDMSSGAVLNTNRVDYENYMNRKKQIDLVKEQTIKHGEEITILKNELSEIKQMIFTLLNNRP